MYRPFAAAIPPRSATVAPIGDVYHSDPGVFRDGPGTVGASVVRDENLAGNAGAFYRLLGFLHAASKRLAFVEARHDNRDFEHLRVRRR